MCCVIISEPTILKVDNLSVRFNRMKIFVVISTMMLQIIKIYYRANLIMDLTATIPPQPINTLQELANIVSTICVFYLLVNKKCPRVIKF